MLKKTITYVDFNGVPQTEDFYFNLTKAELAEMELASNGGLADSMQKVVDSKDGKTIIDEFKKLVFGAYGIKSDDGKRFIKSPEISKEFEQSAAYDVLFMELVTNADEAARFVTQLLPADVQKNVNAPQTQPVAPAQVPAPAQYVAPQVAPPATVNYEQQIANEYLNQQPPVA